MGAQQQIPWEIKAQQAQANEAGYPVHQHLRAQTHELATRLHQALDAIPASWPGATWEQRQSAERRFMFLAAAFIGAIANQHRPLPTNSLCICQGCRKVHLPQGLDGRDYHCQECGRLWGHHRTVPTRPLPAGFWEKALPGDIVKKALLSDEQKEPTDNAFGDDEEGNSNEQHHHRGTAHQGLRNQVPRRR
jgi:hypothetical protein